MSFYESDKALSEYLLFHYGSPEDVLPHEFGPTTALDYPVRCVRHNLTTEDIPENAKALDLGCAVGRSTFELAALCQSVIGIDYSQRFIDAANDLKANGSLPYEFLEEGKVTKSATASLSDQIDVSRVTFEQGDAMDLRKDLGSFDIVLAANLLCRLTEPLKLLNRLPELVNPGGTLILCTPCTWLEEFTPSANWLGGLPDGPKSTLEGLSEQLSANFELKSTRDMPFLIREHARKYQWSVALASVWKRK